jgi:hypothetical protein
MLSSLGFFRRFGAADRRLQINLLVFLGHHGELSFVVVGLTKK